MANIDDKVVSMSFEGSKFESGVRGAVSAIDKLKSSLRFDGVEKGFNNINRASQGVQLGRIADGVENVKNKLQTLKLVGISVLGQLAGSAVRAGASLVKSLSFGPLQQGFQEYSTNLNAVQTILSNTAAQGTKLKDVNAALLDLNKYSDKTIYNFGQMAKNIGTFTAAGVDLDTSTAAIKGIANLAAFSGSSAEQASVAMYQLSQAIAAGRVSLQDWNSVVNAGMGGAAFQRALANTAQAMGKLKEGSVKLVGPMKQLKINGESFRESIGGPGPKWLTSDILTNTLKQFTGDMTKAELKAQGFNDAQIKAIQTQAKIALHAATEVKTFSQVLDVAKEAMGSGWAQTWQLIFGNFGEAKTLFTGVSNSINGFINASAQARNKVLADWKALGGRTVLISAIKTTFQALGEIIAPIKEAFRDIFPAQTGRDLFNLTVQFKAFAEALRPSPETVDNLKRTFRGLFAVLDIGRQIVSGIFTVFSTLFHALGGGNGSFLEFTGNIGDFLVKLDEALKKGDAFHQFFVSLGTAVAVPLKILSQLGHAIANLFSGFSPGGFSGKMDSLSKPAINLKNILEDIGQLLEGLGPAISNAISNINWEAILQVVRTGLFAALVLMMKNFIGGTNLNQIFGIMGKNIGRSFGAGILGNLSKAFGGLTGTLSAMQTELKARTLEEIAIAIALLAASVLALSLVDPDRMSGALGAMTLMFGELLAAMAIMDKITSTGSFVKLPIIAASLILLATAIDLLTISVIAMSKLSWEELTRGLTAVGGLLAGLSAASSVLSKNAAGMIRSSIGILGIAVAMKILASAMKDFAQMNWTEMVKGLVGVGGGLAAIAAGMQLMPKNMLIRSAAIIAIAAALEIIADAMAKFGAMNWTQIGKGLAGIAGSLVVIAGAMHLMPKSMVITAAGLVLVAASLGKIGDAVAKMGGLSIKQIAKGLVGLGGALAILAVSLNAMGGTFAGAAALGVAATGLSLLIPAIVLLGRQSWGTLLKGLVGLGAAIGVIAGAALLLSPSIPALLGFGAALVVIGAGLALAGAGIALIGVGLSAIAVSGSASVGILIKALEDLVASLVDIAKNLVLGILEITKQFAATAPAFAKALGVIVSNLLDVVIQATPKIGQAFEVLLLEALRILAANQDKVIQAGFSLLLALLTGIRNNIGQLVTATVDIIVNFLNAISRNLNRIVTAGIGIMTSLLKGIASNLGKVITAGTTIITNLVTGIGNAFTKVVTAALNVVVKFLGAISSRIGSIIKAGTDVIVNFVTGIGNAGPRIITAGTNAMIKFLNAVVKASLKMIDAGAQAIIKFLNGVADAIEKYEPQMLQAGARIGVAIIKGMINGLGSLTQSLYNKADEIARTLIDKLKKPWKMLSPSKVSHEMGQNIIFGLTNGLTSEAPGAYSAATTLSKGVISSFEDAFQTHSPSKVMIQIGRYVGQGFAQGIRGSKEDINSAFTDLNNKLTDTMVKAREIIASEQDKLDKLRAAKKPDKEAIKEAQQVIAENQSLLALSTAGHIALTKTLRDEKKELIGLVNDYEKVSDKLKKAQDVLKDAIRTRDDAAKSFTDQFSAPPDISGPMVQEIKDARASIKAEQDKLGEMSRDSNSTQEQLTAQYNAVLEAQAKFDTLVSGKVLNAQGTAVDQLATYMQSLKTQADAVAAYSSTLDQLRKLGLDDATYQKLLREGPADQQFASQLLAGGKTAVKSLNTLDAQLLKVSKTLATNAARNLYQAGVDAAEGLVKGLRQEQSKLRKAMEDIAEEMVATLKAKLKIKSPSQVFAEIGKYSMEGVAQGFVNSTGTMKTAIEDSMNEATDALKRSVVNMAKMVEGEINLNPIITPVLDLSKVKAQSGQLATLTSTESFAQASSISTQQSEAEIAVTSTVPGASIKFEQNNYSPESLSDVQIYRQTRNQLSQLKSILAV